MPSHILSDDLPPMSQSATSSRGSVVDAIVSYGRSQTFMSGSNLESGAWPANFSTCDEDEEDEEDDVGRVLDDWQDQDDIDQRMSHSEDGYFDEDEDELIIGGDLEGQEQFSPPASYVPDSHGTSSGETTPRAAGSQTPRAMTPSQPRFHPFTSFTPIRTSPPSSNAVLGNAPSHGFGPASTETTPLLRRGSVTIYAPPPPRSAPAPDLTRTALSDVPEYAIETPDASPGDNPKESRRHSRISIVEARDVKDKRLSRTSIRPVMDRRLSRSSVNNESTQPNGTRGRSISRASVLSVKPGRSRGDSVAAACAPRGNSTFGQTLFNSIAILLGIGMLSEPLAFAYAGWIGGTALIVFYGCLTCYTAKILAKIICSDNRLRTYADIGRKAFGPRSTAFTSALFCLELFAVSVVLVTLYADSLHSVMPAYSSDTYKILGLLFLIPTVFLPLPLLSITSILGIISTLLIIVVVVIDGLSKPDAPGSLWSPAKTDIGFTSYSQLGTAFGLFMAGFSGHAVIPSLARDMADPTQFDTMINWAFGVSTVVYALIGAAGYLMFGRYVSDEVSQDLLRTPGYNPLLNKVAVWMLVVSPLTKFALATRPLNITLEILFNLEPAPSIPSLNNRRSLVNGSANGTKRSSMLPPTKEKAHERREHLKRLGIVFERTLFTVFSVAVSVLIPQFGAMMAFLGAFSAFLLCVIGPVAAKIALERKCSLLDGIIMVIAIVMAIWGTGAAFIDG